MPDPRQGCNKRYAVAEAAACALLPLRPPVALLPRLPAPQARRNQPLQLPVPPRHRAHPLRQPESQPARRRPPPESFDPLFRLGLRTLHEQDALQPFERLGGACWWPLTAPKSIAPTTPIATSARPATSVPKRPSSTYGMVRSHTGRHACTECGGHAWRRRHRLRDFVCQPEPMEQRSTRRPGNLQSGMALGCRSTYKDWGARNPSWPGIPGFHLEVVYIRSDQRLPSMRIPVRRSGGEPYIPLPALDRAAGDPPQATAPARPARPRMTLRPPPSAVPAAFADRIATLRHQTPSPAGQSTAPPPRRGAGTARHTATGASKTGVQTHHAP